MKWQLHSVCMLFSVLAACSSPRTEVASPSAKQAKQGLSSLFGRKTLAGTELAPRSAPTAVVVFASWCGACRKELGIVGELRELYPNLRIIGANAYEEWGRQSDEERLRKFLRDSAPWLEEVTVLEEHELRAFGGVPKIPTLFVYDASGNAVAEFRRERLRQLPSRAELDAAFARASAPSSH